LGEVCYKQQNYVHENDQGGKREHENVQNSETMSVVSLNSKKKDGRPHKNSGENHWQAIPHQRGGRVGGGGGVQLWEEGAKSCAWSRIGEGEEANTLGSKKKKTRREKGGG